MDTFAFVTKDLQNPHFDMVLVRRATADERFFEPADMNLYKEATRLLQEQERKKAQGILETLLAERAGVERDIIRSHYQKQLKMENCQAGTLTAIISEEGEVRPCEILDTSFGNLRDFDYRLDKIWKNALAMQHRERIKRENVIVRLKQLCEQQWFFSQNGLSKRCYSRFR